MFNDLIHVYSPGTGAGQTAPRGQNFDVNRNALSLYPFVASLKDISLKSDFKHFFLDFIHVFSPEAEADNPWGQKFDVTSVICCKLQKNLF